MDAAAGRAPSLPPPPPRPSSLLPGPSPPVSPPARRARTSQFLPIASLLNPHTGVKRRRSDQDVDGPNTAAMSSKKRRLRLKLVTSRLSRPFSLPASHIHGRADGKPGAGRSIKAEAALAAQRRLPHLPATSFLRLSVMNRLRERIGHHGHHGHHGYHGLGAIRPGRTDAGPDAPARPPWHHHLRQRPVADPFSRMPSLLPSAAPGPGRRAVSKKPPPPLTTTTTTTKEKSGPPPSWITLPAPWPKLVPVEKTIPSLSDALPITFDFQPLGRLHGGFDDGFSLPRPDDDGIRAAKEADDVYCDFAVLFGKGQPRCLAGQDQRADVDELEELPLIAR
ncbi:hypothetical protein CDD83_8762 [Cordyceps sp. RAO-2017]|nr:hypothetical protein CDD83_8762 [Cordyceps sp. RAO-2017]